MSTTSTEEDKSAALSRAADEASEQASVPGGTVEAYFRHVAPEDVTGRTTDELVSVVRSHRDLASERPAGRALVRVTEIGERAVVEVVTDDMPFLVDSVTMEMVRQHRPVHLVVHPRWSVRRDAVGNLQDVRAIDDAHPEEAPHDGGWSVESWIRVETDRIVDEEEVDALVAGLERVLRDVREAVEDWTRMRTRMLDLAAGLNDCPDDVPRQEIAASREFLEWLADDHFTFLGCREYALESRPGADSEHDELRLRGVPGTGLGVLRDDPDLTTDPPPLGPAGRRAAHSRSPLVVTKANSRATVHRRSFLDYVGVRLFHSDGSVAGEERFLGLLSSRAYTESILRIPVVRERAEEVLAEVGFDAHSHAGKQVIDILENYPRDELFHTGVDELVPVVRSLLYADQRRRLAAFGRRDPFGRFVSVLVHLPRDRYNTTVRERFSAILREELGGEEVEFAARVDESPTARVHFVLHPPEGASIGDFDAHRVESLLAEASRSWADDFVAAAQAETAGQDPRRLRVWAEAFPEGYKERHEAETAAADMVRIEKLLADPGPAGVDLALEEEPLEEGVDERRATLTVYRVGDPLSLSHVLPLIASLGVEVVDEVPHRLEGLEQPAFVYEFGLRHPGPLPYSDPELFVSALRASWLGHSEVDGLNGLVLDAGLHWRQVSWLRAYAGYMKQGNAPFSRTTVERALRGNVEITRMLVELFETRFDPSLDLDVEQRTAAQEAVEARLAEALDAVVSLDHDRVLRSYLRHLRATLRTNAFRTDESGARRPALALKLDPEQLPELPQPRPAYEIFVNSPRVDGVHLRFGQVARGGLRWSDRPDDFRTEVLGLVKAQMVKNTVIVPVGAKGGFVAKQLPDPSDREAWLAEGVACYRTFISGLLDVTDNLVDGHVVPPDDVVRHDGDDHYLVVAADKGTATFSDIANELAVERGFWLGDAFASGGSVGYDHKAMGITARGAWVSVQRHFRERGLDVQREEFTCVGIGDMSGDVFGNGMLLSPTMKLVAAFDHRDVFLDPDPDPATSYAERRRLFELPRSSWQDYDAALISEGGGVHSRSAKSVPITPQVREVLGLDDSVTHLPPNELIRAVLRAPVDLLWNGGVGTYVKASTETHADVGDKAGDAVRVDGRELRARCVGEGGNLGFTQAGRIEYAREAQGAINTDFIDNSAGVDTSDREVNIKILLRAVADAGKLSAEERPELLARMTDEVGQLVLHDNYEQNIALSNAVSTAPEMLHVHEDWMKVLERRGVVDRELEGLPSSKEVRRRIEAGEGLSGPELAVLLSWTKIVLADDLLASDLPDDPYLRGDLFTYFPSALRQDFRAQMSEHPLRREIVTTQVVNALVNGAGMTYWMRLAAETGRGAAELTRANFVARELFGAAALRADIDELDHRVAASVQTAMRLEKRTLVERAARWLVQHSRAPLDSETVVDRFSVPVQRLMADLPSMLTGREADAFAQRRDELVRRGVPDELATRVAVLPPAYALLGVVETAGRDDVAEETVARVHFALGERLGLSALARAAVELPRQDRWQAMARAALRDDLYAVHGQLTAEVLARAARAGEATTEPLDQQAAEEQVARWKEDRGGRVEEAVTTLEEIVADDDVDLARMSVGLRVVRSLLAPA
ncbi:NAD-glutamate dehydrogenase [Nocardioides sp. Y6]|uniref:NAD-glutamate dehydrogenase n=1 Tax=Nocardioides malaquae TaxID=2773426 RepID=A0ABR9RQK9_9ACTN|nr:NAD-glutamate dehydrogenase [Nocardioides malaquae]MBE7323808.1 NAD-glutamate dehydrogenase [Nocardioides malaquae]